MKVFKKSLAATAAAIIVFSNVCSGGGAANH